MSKKSARRGRTASSEMDRDAWVANAVLAAAKKVVKPCDKDGNGDSKPHGDNDSSAIGVMPGRDKSRFV